MRKPLRTVTVGDVFKLFAAAEQPPTRRRMPIQETHARRNYVLLRLLYTAGLRVDEIAHLAWRDLRERGDGPLEPYLLVDSQKESSAL